MNKLELFSLCVFWVSLCAVHPVSAEATNVNSILDKKRDINHSLPRSQLDNTLHSSQFSAQTADNQELKIENKHYLFDVKMHTIDELQSLLSHVAKLTEESPEAYDDLEIVMVLHGPDINYFTKKKYDQNKSIIDLAAKLDAFKTIDLKVCEAAMNSLGFDAEELPKFIETVPFAPETISNFKQKGYINL